MNNALIELALKILPYNQKEFAQKMNVSSTQITKWKQREYMSFEMDNKLRGLLDMNTMSAEFVLTAGSVENAKKWESLSFIWAKARICTVKRDTTPQLGGCF